MPSQVVCLVTVMAMAITAASSEQVNCDSYDMEAKEEPSVFLTVNSRDRKVELNWVEPSIVEPGDWVGLFKSQPNQTASKRDSGIIK